MILFAKRTNNLIRRPAAESIGPVIAKADAEMAKEAPDALLLGDTSSCRAAIAAKCRRIPIFRIGASTLLRRARAGGGEPPRRRPRERHLPAVNRAHPALPAARRHRAGNRGQDRLSDTRGARILPAEDPFLGRLSETHPQGQRLRPSERRAAPYGILRNPRPMAAQPRKLLKLPTRASGPVSRGESIETNRNEKPVGR